MKLAFEEVVKERLNINSEKKEVVQENESEDDTKGYPQFLFNSHRKDADGNMDEDVNAQIIQYLVNWQCATVAYNDRMGIEVRIPTWIHKIDSDDCCPKFSDKEIEFINEKL